MKRSPAPWKHYTAPLRKDFPVRIHEIHDANGREVVKWGGFDGMSIPRSQVNANAKLLAAAYDLEEACKAAIPFIAEFAVAGNEHAPRVLKLMRRALKRSGGDRTP